MQWLCLRILDFHQVHASLSERTSMDTAAFRDVNETPAWLDIELEDDELISG